MAFHRPGNEFPQQVSAEASEDRSEIAFSNGASFPAHVNEYSMNSTFETTFVRDGFLNPPERNPARLPSPHYGVTGATVRLTHQARHPIYAEYGERLRSFARWTHSNPDPVCLCNAGFFFTNEGDLVRCFSCGIGLKDFTDRDDPLREHVRHSGNCLYLLEHLGTKTLASIKASCQEQQRIQGNSATQCRHPEYQSYESRLSTFTRWPSHLSQRPEDLADAGLFYKDEGDLVRCFSCGIALKDFPDRDDPLREHVRHSGNCLYLLDHLGTETLASIKASCQEQQRIQGNSATQCRHPEYQSYESRLSTFTRWPSHLSQRPEDLADAGLFYKDEGDLVRCFSCGIALKDFTDRDDPLREHVRHSGNCLYLLDHLGTETLASIKASCQEQQRIQGNSATQYRHPDYQSYESFTGWPSHLSQRQEDLAAARLFNRDVDDLVRGFSCDGGLKRWDAEDVPWTEYCRWFPTYTREMTSEDFIDLRLASSVYNQEGLTNNEESVGSENLQGAMYQVTLRDPVLRPALEEHKKTCLEMGYGIDDVNEAVDDLRNMGTITPTFEELIDMIEVVKERKQSKEIARQLEKCHQETTLEENQRLKRIFTCMICGKNNVNCLFVPCTHHRLCMECATLFTKCPVCDRQIRQKIKTYLV